MSIINRKVFHCVYIHLIFNRINTGTAQISRLLDKERFIDIHRFLVHPHHHCLKITVDNRQVIRMYQHFTTRHINLIFQSQCNRLRWKRIIQLPVISYDTFYLRRFSRRKCHHCIPLTDNTGCDLTAETSKVQIRAKYILNRETEIRQIMVIIDMNGFQKIQQRDSFIPRSTFRFIHYIISIQSGKRNTVHIRNSQRSNEFLVFGNNLVEPFFREVHQVHLVYCQYDMLDTQQRYQESMAACLCNHSHTGVYQNNS